MKSGTKARHEGGKADEAGRVCGTKLIDIRGRVGETFAVLFELCFAPMLVRAVSSARDLRHVVLTQLWGGSFMDMPIKIM